MAEDKVTEPAGDGEEEAPADSASPNSKKRLIIAVAALVVFAGGVAYWLLRPLPEGDAMAEEPAPPPREPAQYLELEPAFVINLPDRGRQRFLQASVTVMSRNRGAILTIEQHMPVIRHSLSAILSAQTVESIQTPGGIEMVRADAKRELNKILAEEYGSEAIEEVLFTAFVMQ